MIYGNSSARYLENEVMSRSPEWLVPLLYEHLLGSLRRAQVQMEAVDIEGKAASLSKANAILLELTSTLDHEQGGEIAKHLSSLYAFFAGVILDAGRSNEPRSLDRPIELIADLHDAWTQAAEQVAPRGRKAAGPVAAVA